MKTPDYLKAEPYFNEVLKLSQSLNQDAAGVEATIGLGKIEEKKGVAANALNYYNSARTKAEDINSDELD